jgi:mannose-6-phosphate isomerase
MIRNVPFPLLVKWLDCRERLSLQVHPPAEIAPALRGEPKTENWYIAEAEPGARPASLGLKRWYDLERSLPKHWWNTALRVVRASLSTVSMGDSILVRSGTMHAIDAGNLILEIQQNSDTTYRVYDWGRVGTGW